MQILTYPPNRPRNAVPAMGEEQASASAAELKKKSLHKRHHSGKIKASARVLKTK